MSGSAAGARPREQRIQEGRDPWIEGGRWRSPPPPEGLTLQGLPSTVCSSNSSPILKLISVVRTVVEVLM